MPRFVILRHTVPRDSLRGDHWDLMFEIGGVLRTWAVDGLPAAGSVAALRLPDHRLAYLNLEGEISGNRGSVTRWDRGDFDLLEDQPRRMVVVVRGEKLAGRITFEMPENADVTHSEVWTMTIQSDSPNSLPGSDSRV